MSTCRLELYRLSPVDSVAVRRSLRGFSQFGVLTLLVMTSVILLFLILLPGGSRVVALVVLALLLLEYLATALAALVPRFFMGRIIRAEKDQQMGILQAQLNDLLPRVGELTEEEREEMTQLQETHDAIRDSPESLLPLGAIFRTAGALLLSTLTVLVTAFAQEWLAEWTKRFVP